MGYRIVTASLSFNSRPQRGGLHEVADGRVARPRPAQQAGEQPSPGIEGVAGVGNGRRAELPTVSATFALTTSCAGVAKFHGPCSETFRFLAVLPGSSAIQSLFQRIELVFQRF